MSWAGLCLVLPQGTKHTEYKGIGCTVLTRSLT